MRNRISLKTLVMSACFCVASLHAQQTYYDFFDSTKVHDIYLTLNPADYDSVRFQGADDKTYYSGTFQWNNITIAADMRQKGRASRNIEKPSFKLKFSKKNRFLGLHELELKSNVEDGSQLHQMVSLTVFDRAGQPGRLQSHARVYMNGQLLGLYLAVEFVNDDYLQRIFGNNDGVLYDFGPDPSYNFEFKGVDPADYVVNFDPDQPDNPDHKPLIEFITAMNLSTDDEFKDAVGKYLDWKQFMTFLAVQQYLSDDDGLVGKWGMNNFYLYMNTATKKFVFIPTDCDLTFATTEEPSLSRIENTPLTRRAMANPELRAMFYEAQKRAMAVTGSTDGWLKRTVEWRRNMIRDSVYADPNKRCDWGPCTNERFEEYCDYMIGFSEERQGFVMDEMATAGITTAGLISSDSGIALQPNGIAQITWKGGNPDGVQVWVNGFPSKILTADPTQITFEGSDMLFNGLTLGWVVSDGNSLSFPASISSGTY